MTTTIFPASRALWFPLLAPPIAWALQELLGWFFGERICGAMTPPAVRLTVLGISVLALAVALGGALTGWRTWRGSSDSPTVLATDAGDRREFMALAGLLVSAVFSLAIVWAGLSSAFIGDCGRVR